MIGRASAGYDGRRRQRAGAGLACLALGVAGTVASPPVAADPTDRAADADRAQPPNVLVLMTDDQNVLDLDAMPQTRRLLGGDGTTFDRAISTYPLCTPARATLLSGQLPHNHQMMGNHTDSGAWIDESKALPVRLQRAGYRTSMIGKYLNGYGVDDPTRVPPGWDRWQVPVKDIYHYDGSLVNTDGRLARSSMYQTSWITENVTKQIEQSTSGQGSEPFFVWANYLAPHTGGPHEADDPDGDDALETPAVQDKYRDSFAGPDISDAPAFNEPVLSDKGSFLRGLPKIPPKQADEAYQQRLESLQSVDDSVARIVTELKDQGVWDDTVVMFVSDNGYQVGQHRWVQKVLGYEESIRIPLIIRGPGFAAGVHRDQQVNLADLSATVLEAAAVGAPADADGIALQPLSRNPDLGADRPQLLEAGAWRASGAEHLYRGVRTADDKVLLRWYDGPGGPDPEEEVYDLRSDPHQLDGDPSGPLKGQLPGLRRELAELADCSGSSCHPGLP